MGQSEIPPEVRAALFPQTSSNSTRAEPTREHGYTANRPQIAEKPRNSFNDSLFQVEQGESFNSSNNPAVVSREPVGLRESKQGMGQVMGQDIGQDIGLMSFEAAINYQPVMDRAPDIRPNQAVSIADYPKPDRSARSLPNNQDREAQLRTLSAKSTREPNWHTSVDDASPPATTLVTGMPTLAELLEESNRGIKKPRNPVGSGDKDSSINDLEQIEDARASNSIPGSANVSNGWTGLRNTGSSTRFVDTLQRIGISVVLVLFLGVSFIVIAKRWLTGTSQLVQRSVADQPNSRTKSAGILSGIPLATSPNEEDTRIRIKNQLKLDDRSVLYLIEVAGQSVLVANDTSGIKSVVPILPSFTDGMERLDPLDDTVDSVADEVVNRMHESQITREENRAGAYRPGRVAEAPAESTTHQNQNPRRHLDEPRGDHHHTDRAGTTEAENKDQLKIEEEMKRRLAELLGGQAFQEVFYQQSQAKS